MGLIRSGNTSLTPVSNEKELTNHFSDIKKYASIVENRMEDEGYTIETALRDNAKIAEIESIWNFAFGMCGLFQSTAVEFSKKQNFSYDFEQAKNSLNFLQHVRKLPVNAKEICWNDFLLRKSKVFFLLVPFGQCGICQCGSSEIH